MCTCKKPGEIGGERDEEGRGCRTNVNVNVNVNVKGRRLMFE